MILRKGKTKHLIENSTESALLAVETYNSPKKEFRFGSYIVLMIIALTKLFHAYFYHSIGNKYYYKNSNGRYRIVDGERKTWELKTCIEKYGNLSDPVRRNFLFFIKLRNRIEHSTVDQSEIGKIIFGECQALLYNYENLGLQRNLWVKSVEIILDQREMTFCDSFIGEFNRWLCPRTSVVF